MQDKQWPETLLDNQSLTQKLRAAAKHVFFVEVIFEGFITVLPKDVPLLHLTQSMQTWCRQVHLWVDKAIWVEGKTIIPKDCLQHPKLESLLYIHNQSLGDTLWMDPNLTRSTFEIKQNTRSSVFLFYGYSILLYETFKPEALNYFGYEASS